MKKLLIFFMLMGLVTTVNAQTSIAEMDFITEQVINSVSSLKINSESSLYTQSFSLGYEDIAETGINPFQYIQQPIDYISIASAYYGLYIKEAFVKGESIGGKELMLEIHSDTANQVDEEDSQCSKLEKVNL